MIRLENYKITGYKNIDTADISFGNYNIIIGPNNSGKSNLIQSISFLNFIINAPTDDLEKYFKRGFYPTHFGEIIPNKSFIEGQPNENVISFNLIFSNTETKRRFDYSLDISHNVRREKSVDNNYKISSESLTVKELGKPGSATRVFTRKDDKVIYGTDFQKQGLLEAYPPYLSVIRVLKIYPLNNPDYIDAIFSFNQILKTPTFYFSHTELSKKREESDKLSILNGRIVALDVHDEIIKIEQSSNWEIFKTALENILGISMVYVLNYHTENPINKERKEQKVILFEHVNHFKSLEQFSDGTKLLIALITMMLTSQNDIFFIEEPENSTHPKALVDLINFINSFTEQKQFIITSHSIVLLNKSKIENIITSCVNQSGNSEIFNVSSKKELKQRLKYSNFSDELFFGNNESEEFE